MYQKLMTKAVEARIPALGSTDGKPLSHRRVAVKFFTPDSGWTWYVAEGQRREDGDWEFFGYVEGTHSEWGYFTLNQLKQVRGPFGLQVERDMHLVNITFFDILKREEI